MTSRKKKIEIGEDIAQQHKVWLLERVSWSLMGLIVLAALTGLLGHGYFSARESAVADSGIVVVYQRYERYRSPTLLSVQLTEAPAAAETRLRVGQDFLRGVELSRIEPAPARVELDGAFMTYVFNANAPGVILFHYTPIRAGTLRIEIGLEQRALQSLRQFVYP